MSNWNEIKLVLLPGLDGKGLLFEPLLNELSGSEDISIISYPGDSRLSYNDLTEYVAGQLPESEPFVILAESFSGPVALKLAGRGLHQLKGIIFCATFAESPRPLLLSLINTLPVSLISQLARSNFAIRYFCFGSMAKGPLLKLYERVLSETGSDILSYRLKEIDNLNISRTMDKIKIPCCYIQASSDKFVPSRCVDMFTTLAENLVVKRIDGHHFILQTEPVKCASIIDEFMRGVACGLLAR